MVDEEKEIGAEELVKQSLLQKAEISLILDTYDDIFSDFDPRPFGQRALSDDFLIEAKKAAKDKEDNIELSFMIPKDKRRMDYELVIKKRLRDHFRKHALVVEKEIKQIKWLGIKMVLLGMLFIFAGAFVHFYLSETLWTSFLIIVLEPAGWFTFWEGLNHFLFEFKPKKPELDFYQKMTRCEISFHTY